MTIREIKKFNKNKILCIQIKRQGKTSKVVPDLLSFKDFCNNKTFFHFLPLKKNKKKLCIANGRLVLWMVLKAFKN